jgi:hypothetical protein
MATHTGRVRLAARTHDDGSTRRLGRFLEPALVVLAVLALGAGTIAVRSPAPAIITVSVADITGGAPAGTPVELTAAAADLLEATTRAGGTGYRFEIVQRSTLVAREGGPLLDIPDPADPAKSLGATDRYYLNGLTQIGHVTPDGFYAELRSGPPSPDAVADVAGGELQYRALVAGGVTYRDDGEGWYPTEDPPGIGLDPITASLLPRLLRAATDATERDAASLTTELVTREAATRALAATAAVADLPGIIAVDGAEFTELTEPVTFTFDAAGRLSGIRAVARNTNLEGVDLIVVTEIAIAYDTVPVDLPDPVPAHPDPDAIVTAP